MFHFAKIAAREREMVRYSHMRIAIDARMMGPENTRGIGRYVEELVRGLLSLETGDTYVLLVRDPAKSPFLGHSQVEHLVADVPWYTFEEQRRMPRLLHQAKADVVHVPHWNVPFAFRGKLVATIHDLLLVHQPMSAKASTRAWPVVAMKQVGFRVTLQRTLRQANVLLVPTQAVADDIVSYFPAAKDKILVTGEGVSSLPTPPDRAPERPFFFYVGSAYPHKRLDLLLDAWAVLAPRLPTHELRLGGEMDVFMRRHQTRVLAEKIPRVRFLGRLTDAELAWHDARATAFVFPSSFEGFGLPPLEALSLGTPVIAADIPVLREVLPPDGVIFFRNGDRDDMIRAFDALLSSLDTWRAQVRILAQPKIAERHTWRATAERTHEGYRRIVP
jgi:alpha-1,3-rhamnosyl/mannosyltransferase